MKKKTFNSAGFAMFQIYTQVEGFHPVNSTDVNVKLVSSNMFL